MSHGRSSWVAVSGGVWLAAATAVGGSGVLTGVRPPGPQILIAALTAAVVLAGVFVPPLRRWAAAVDLRVVVGLHLTRLVGAYFLYLYGRGDLPYAFAVPAGVGDIAVAALALVLIAAARPDARRGRRLYLGWNVLGAADILGVVGTAAAQGMSDAGSMAALLRLPLCLLATFLVPLVIASHVLIFARLLGLTGPGRAEPAAVSGDGSGSPVGP